MQSAHAVGLALVLVCLPSSGIAEERPRGTVEFSGGYAGFVDDVTVKHGTFGAAWRWRATRRVSVGPELVYMRGPGRDREVVITGKLLVDVAPERAVSPYLVADGGVMFHQQDLPGGIYRSSEPAVSGGGGLRIDVTPRLFVAPEVRLGWEAHMRLTVYVGWRLGS